MVGDMPIIWEINDDIENDYSNIKRTGKHLKIWVQIINWKIL